MKKAILVISIIVLLLAFNFAFARSASIKLITNVSPIVIDQDSDGIPDTEDNCLDTYNPNQDDSDHDGYGNICDSDFDNNEVVDYDDFNLFKPSYNSQSGDANYDEQMDANLDEYINLIDFAIFGLHYTAGIPGPSGLTCAGSVPCPDINPPIISNIKTIGITSTSTTITWLTDEDSNTVLNYGFATSSYEFIAYGNTTATTTISSSTIQYFHEVKLSNLNYGTTHHYKVSSTDNYNNTTEGEDMIFTTANYFPLMSSNWNMSPAFNGYSPVAVYNGSGYGVVWATERNSGESEIYFTRLNIDGIQIGEHLLISSGHSTADPNYTISWNGNEYLVIWEDYWGNVPPGGNSYDSYDTYLVKINSNGEKISDNIEISSSGQLEHMHLFWTGSQYNLIYINYRPNEIGFMEIGENGQPIGTPKTISTNINSLLSLSVAWNGEEYGMVWNAQPGSGGDIYFGILSTNGDLLSTELLPKNQPYTIKPLIFWNGTEYAITYVENVSPPTSLENSFVSYFVRFNADGIKQGDTKRIFTNGGPGMIVSMLWDGSIYKIIWLGELDGSSPYISTRNGQLWIAELDNQGNRLGEEFYITQPETTAWITTKNPISFLFVDYQYKLFVEINGKIYYLTN